MRGDLEIHPLSEEHLDDAAALLAERHQRHRETEPLLADVADFRPHVAAELARGAGVAAVRGGELVGYLIGRVQEHPPGAVAQVEPAGHAAADPEVVRDLYAALAHDWVAADVTRHQAMVPSSDDGLRDAWSRLAFGVQFMTAARETEAAEPVDAGVEIRPGTPDDLPAVAAFDRILWRLQTESPSFSGLSLEGEDFEAEWADTWDDPDTFQHFVAERDGRAVGHALLYRRPTGDLRIPEDNIDLAHAATLDAVRGSGVGLALTAHVLRWAHEHGFRSMTTDWRSVNLLSSRFWPRRGFRPTFVRMYRAVP